MLFLPPQTIGNSDEHIEYPGTLTLPFETLVGVLTAIGDSVARAGCRKLVFINSHGGNVPAIDAAALSLRARHAMLCVHASWRRLGYPDGMFSERERVYGMHGGDAETSLMLAFRPETVKMDEARDFASAGEAMAAEFKRLRGAQPIGFAWMASDLNRDGAVGEAAVGDGGQGRGRRRPRRRRLHRAAARRRRLRSRATRPRPARLNDDGRADLRHRARADRARGGAWSPASTRSAAGRSPGRSASRAVILDPDDLPEGLDDSKALTAARREALAEAIYDQRARGLARLRQRRRDRPLQHPRRDAARDGARGRGALGHGPISR